MSLITARFFSDNLRRPTEIQIILPVDVPKEIRGANPHYTRPAKTLILLNGYSGSNTDWLINAPTQDLAVRYNLAIVTMNGDNSFYLNGRGTGRKYCSLVGEELPQYLANVFGLAKTREDTFIGGLSMGGFGALHTGLAYPETFSRIIALSSALIVHEVAAMRRDDGGNIVADYDYYVNTFGEPETLLESPNNPEFLVKKHKKAGTPLPGIFMACGTEDFLIEPNRDFRDFLTREGADLTYTEAPGVHDWKFWGAHIEPAIQWALSK